MIELAPAVRDHLARLYPSYRVANVATLGKDVTTDATAKAAGYGTSLRISLAADEKPAIDLVFRVASANEFGHDRPSDRAAAALLAFDDFAAVPDHVPPIDVGTIRDDGTLVSLRDNPQFSAQARGALLGLVECALETQHLDPQWADELFR